MLKKLLIGTVLLSTSLMSHAGFISQIDGADMAGIEVTAFFGNGTQDTQTWAATSIDAGAAGSADWSLSLSGETFGNVLPSGGFDGVWVFDNTSSTSVVGIEIKASVADVYFDNVDTVVGTAGSDVGREFVADNVNNSLVNAAFSDAYAGTSTDLFGTLNISFLSGFDLASGESLEFFIDTDKATVSEPATALVFLTGLLALVNIRRKA